MKSSLPLVLLLLVLLSSTALAVDPIPPIDPIPPEPPWNPFLDFLDALWKFGEFLWNGIMAAGRVLGWVVEGFRLIGSGFAALASIFGQAGNPAAKLTGGRPTYDRPPMLTFCRTSQPALRFGQRV